MTTGAQLIARLEARAHELGVNASSLSGSNAYHLREIARALNPKPKTIARIEAAIAGRRTDPEAITAATAPVPLTRDPCFKCGTRADFGCKHRQTLP